MTKIPVVFAFSDNFAMPASIAIKSLIDNKNVSTEYDIFVIYDELAEDVKKKFETITDINWLQIAVEIFDKAPSNSYWRKSVYYRLLIPSLIKKYDKVIYSDVDVLFKSDLSEIFNRDVENFYWAGVIAEKNDENTQCHKYFVENKNEYIYMSGFMLVNCKKMREDDFVSKMFDTIEKFAKRLDMFDLEVLNLSTEKISAIPFEYCTLENIYNEKDIKKAPEYLWLSKVYPEEILLEAKKNPKIIHYAGKNPKIWKRKTDDIPGYYFEYIKKSPFYENEYYYPTLKMIMKKVMYKILAKLSFKKEIRHIYKEKLNDFHY